MNESQTVFALFFAIFWGSIMNVSGRWRMFQPFFWHPRIRRRFVLSFLVMMVLPVWFFAWAYQCLKGLPLDSAWDVARAVLPSLFIYVFYRAWMAIVGRFPRVFYWDPGEAVPNARLRKIDLNPVKLGLTADGYGPLGNAVVGVFYAWVALDGPWLVTKIEELIT